MHSSTGSARHDRRDAFKPTPKSDFNWKAQLREKCIARVKEQRSSLLGARRQGQSRAGNMQAIQSSLQNIISTELKHASLASSSSTSMDTSQQERSEMYGLTYDEFVELMKDLETSLLSEDQEILIEEQMRSELQSSLSSSSSSSSYSSSSSSAFVTVMSGSGSGSGGGSGSSSSKNGNGGVAFIDEDFDDFDVQQYVEELEQQDQNQIPCPVCNKCQLTFSEEKSAISSHSSLASSSSSSSPPALLHISCNCGLSILIQDPRCQSPSHVRERLAQAWESHMQHCQHRPIYFIQQTPSGFSSASHQPATAPQTTRQTLALRCAHCPISGTVLS